MKDVNEQTRSLMPLVYVDVDPTGDKYNLQFYDGLALVSIS